MIDRTAAALVVAVVVMTSEAHADETIPHRPPLAEPIFTESVTDIDGYEPGEVEFDINGSEFTRRTHIHLRPIEAIGVRPNSKKSQEKSKFV